VGQWLTLFNVPGLQINSLGEAIATGVQGANIQSATQTSYTISSNFRLVPAATTNFLAIIFRSGLGQAALPDFLLFQITNGKAIFYSQTGGAYTVISQASFSYPVDGIIKISIVVTPTGFSAVGDDGDIYNNTTILSVTNNTLYASQQGVGIYASAHIEYAIQDFRVVA
jgi:hypothetical protein